MTLILVGSFLVSAEVIDKGALLLIIASAYALGWMHVTDEQNRETQRLLRALIKSAETREDHARTTAWAVSELEKRNRPSLY